MYNKTIHDVPRLNPRLPFYVIVTLRFRNFLFAPSGTNSYEFSTFTGIRDAFAEYLKTRSVTVDDENEARVAVERQISMVTVAIQSAYSILSEEEYFQ